MFGRRLVYRFIRFWFFILKNVFVSQFSIYLFFCCWLFVAPLFHSEISVCVCGLQKCDVLISVQKHNVIVGSNCTTYEQASNRMYHKWYRFHGKCWASGQNYILHAIRNNHYSCFEFLSTFFSLCLLSSHSTCHTSTPTLTYCRLHHTSLLFHFISVARVWYGKQKK